MKLLLAERLMAPSEEAVPPMMSEVGPLSGIVNGIGQNALRRE